MVSGCPQEPTAAQCHPEACPKSAAVALGASPDNLGSHAKFAEAQGLSFPVIGDTDVGVTMRYGARTEKSMYGAEAHGRRADNIRD
jgi:peroxiredoxin Q/BCP